jgi:hypothetical protein
MKYVFTLNPINMDFEIIQNLLEQANIPYVIRNAALSMGDGVLPSLPPEIWILNDEDHAQALEIVDACENSEIENDGPWVCRCGEAIEGQFTSCWKCGKERPLRS